MRAALARLMVAVALTIGAVSEVRAHAGSPWHGTGAAAALGLNSLHLELPPGQERARFRVAYPVRPNRLDYVVGNTSSVIVFSNDALVTRGFITEEDVLLAQENSSYDASNPLIAEFEITRSGVYHVLFGPGTNTSILVLEPALTIRVEPVTAGARAGDFLARATSGDFHVVKHPTEGLRRFAAWFAVFFDEFAPVYRQNGVPTADDIPLRGERAVRYASAVADRGYPQFANFPLRDALVSGPFLGHVNGLGADAFDSAFLQPGEYEFVYRPRQSRASIIRTNEFVLQVIKDSVFDRGFGTESDVIARAEFPADRPEFRLRFRVQEAGFYHLYYGPGEGGFIFHMDYDDELPTEVVAVAGTATDHVRLVGLNTVMIGQRPLQLGGSWQVFFPCKIIREKASARGLLTNISIPLQIETAVEVSRFGSAIMQPIMTEFLRSQIQIQNRELETLRNRR